MHTAVYLHSDSLSPDPLYGRPARRRSRLVNRVDLYPHALVRVRPQRSGAKRWAATLNMHSRPRALALGARDALGPELLLDFGTELEAELEVELQVGSACVVYVHFGESVPEAEGLGLPMRVPGVPPLVEHRYVASAGRHRLTYESRGFRFVRIAVPDAGGTVTFRRLVAHAQFVFSRHRGDFQCSDRRFQRVWQASAYTARLCTRPAAYWDGIKRDRVGWYGDARITQETTDAVFFDPRPAEAMLVGLPTTAWANHIPVYSFDAIAMLKQLLLAYGPRKSSQEIYGRVREMLRWTERTQTSREGLLARNPEVQYFFGIGFLDWSPMPVGGRFEELSWLQFRYIEALRNAADVARWLGHGTDAARYSASAGRLGRIAMKRFYRRGRGFVHTLNRSRRGWEKLAPDRHYRGTYVDRMRLGPSGPSRHSCSLAAWAGLCTTEQARRDVLRALDNDRLSPVITPYFAYYEQCGRAECGDPAGALMNMRQYVGEQLERNDSATVWESFEPEVTGFRRWGLGTWPKSLCHGWSSGIVPMSVRYLLGVRPVEPGFRAVVLREPARLPWTFEARLPTPQGDIMARRQTPRGAVSLALPSGVAVHGRVPDSITVQRRRNRRSTARGHR